MYPILVQVRWRLREGQLCNVIGTEAFAKNSKTLRLHPLIENSAIPLYLDEQKLLIKEGLVQMTDQILLFRKDRAESFDILDYERVLQEIR